MANCKVAKAICNQTKKNSNNTNTKNATNRLKNLPPHKKEKISIVTLGRIYCGSIFYNFYIHFPQFLFAKSAFPVLTIFPSTKM